VQLQSPYPSSFILLADPEFSKLTELTAGLDFAFPAANKIGEWGGDAEDVMVDQRVL
jgi:small ligand-binding sensory domain FIST